MVGRGEMGDESRSRPRNGEESECLEVDILKPGDVVYDPGGFECWPVLSVKEDGRVEVELHKGKSMTVGRSDVYSKEQAFSKKVKACVHGEFMNEGGVEVAKCTALKMPLDTPERCLDNCPGRYERRSDAEEHPKERA